MDIYWTRIGQERIGPDRLSQPEARIHEHARGKINRIEESDSDHVKRLWS
jgi:hypothetical protein